MHTMSILHLRRVHPKHTEMVRAEYEDYGMVQYVNETARSNVLVYQCHLPL